MSIIIDVSSLVIFYLILSIIYQYVGSCFSRGSFKIRSLIIVLIYDIAFDSYSKLPSYKVATCERYIHHGRYVTYTGFVKIDNPEGGQRGLNQRSPGSNQSNLPNNFS